MTLKEKLQQKERQLINTLVDLFENQNDLKRIASRLEIGTLSLHDTSLIDSLCVKINNQTNLIRGIQYASDFTNQEWEEIKLKASKEAKSRHGIEIN